MKKFILLFAVFLSGCSLFAPPALPTPTKPPTFTPGPTATIAPTATPNITATPAPTLTPTPPPFPTPDPEFYQQYQFSPDGEWIAWIGADPEDITDPNLLVENRTGDKSWLVTLDDQVHDQFCLGACAFEPVLWAEDGASVYVRAYIAFEGQVFSESDAVSMLQVSLDDGTITPMLPPRIPSYFFVLSPDETWLLFSFSDGGFPIFTLINLETHERDSFMYSIHSDHYGNFYWSPYDRCIVFEAYIFGEDDAIHLINTEDLSHKLLYKGDLFTVEYIEWVSATEIKLTFNTGDPPILINTQTGETTPAD